LDTVQTWMSAPAIVALQRIPLPQGRQLMREQHIRRLPIVDADGQLVGIVTEGDINRVSDSPATDVRDYNLYHRVSDLPIGEIMSQTVVAVAPDTPIVEVARLLLEHRIGGVPVVAEGRVIGVITESDLFRLIVARGTQATQQSSKTAIAVS
jgi:CBS domain-containing protein